VQIEPFQAKKEFKVGKRKPVFDRYRYLGQPEKHSLHIGVSPWDVVQLLYSAASITIVLIVT
jgi:hypothetical protein